MSFGKLELLDEFDGFYKEMGFRGPTLVQKKVIPEALGKSSLLVVAQTGAGKTLSFGLPLFHKLKVTEEDGIKPGPYPRSIVLCPTKELASQIYQEFKKISHHVKLRVRLLAGGQSASRQRNLTNGMDILVGTPTRVFQAIQKKQIKLNRVEHFILDEADQLLDMGFKKEITTMINKVKSFAQFGFYSATLSVDIELFINEALGDLKLKHLVVGQKHALKKKAQTYNVFAQPAEKVKLLQRFLEKSEEAKGIIFVNQKNQVESLYTELQRLFPKMKFNMIHGDLKASEREEHLKKFRNSKRQILVATDVVARGIDIKNLGWVLNFYLPRNAVYYLHRCGRVVRGNNVGSIYNFVTPQDTKFIKLINEAIAGQTSLSLTPIKEKAGSGKGTKKTTGKQKTVRSTRTAKKTAPNRKTKGGKPKRSR